MFDVFSIAAQNPILNTAWTLGGLQALSVPLNEKYSRFSPTANSHLVRGLPRRHHPLLDFQLNINFTSMRQRTTTRNT